MTQEEYQSKLDALKAEKKKLDDQKSEIVKALKKDGFFLDGSTVRKVEAVYGSITEWRYYSRYVGEKGAMYDGGGGAMELPNFTDEDYNRIVNLINNYEISSAKSSNMTDDEVIAETEWFDEFLAHEGIGTEHFSFMPSTFYWDYSGGSSKKVELSKSQIRKECCDNLDMLSIEADGTIKWQYSGSDDQGELCDDDTYFTIGKYTTDFLKNFKSYDYNDQFE